MIPKKLTKRICCGKLGEIFDVIGLVTPIVAGLKVDVRELIDAGCGWDDRIPPECYKKWESNFHLIENIGNIKYNRVVIPENAESLSMEIICAGDASMDMVCATCYARFKLKGGSFTDYFGVVCSP